MNLGKKSTTNKTSPAAYVLLLLCPARQVRRVAALGLLELEAGYYLYVGSGGANVLKRIERHLRPQKTRRWQVDWLTTGRRRLRPAEVCILPGLEECTVARMLGRWLQPVQRLGASDCACSTHLFYSKDAALVHRVLGKLTALASAL